MSLPFHSVAHCPPDPPFGVSDISSRRAVDPPKARGDVRNRTFSDDHRGLPDGGGVGLLLAPKIPWLGRLPGDFTFHRGRTTIYFPLGTCILISIVLTLIFSLWRK
jgi:hypothetical protein